MWSSHKVGIGLETLWYYNRRIQFFEEVCAWIPRISRGNKKPRGVGFIIPNALRGLWRKYPAKNPNVMLFYSEFLADPYYIKLLSKPFDFISHLQHCIHIKRLEVSSLNIPPLAPPIIGPLICINFFTKNLKFSIIPCSIQFLRKTKKINIHL